MRLVELRVTFDLAELLQGELKNLVVARGLLQLLLDLHVRLVLLLQLHRIELVAELAILVAGSRRCGHSVDGSFGSLDELLEFAVDSRFRCRGVDTAEWLGTVAVDRAERADERRS